MSSGRKPRSTAPIGRQPRRIDRPVEAEAAAARERREAVLGAVEPGRHDVHRRRAEETRDEHARRTAIDLERRADLRDPAVVHDADAVAERHRLDLVVGDVDHRRFEPAMELRDLLAGRGAQARVEVRERLVEEEDLGIAHDGAAERDALALAAGERMRAAIEQLREPERGGDVLDALVDLGPRRRRGGAGRRRGSRARSCAG